MNEQIKESMKNGVKFVQELERNTKNLHAHAASQFHVSKYQASKINESYFLSSNTPKSGQKIMSSPQKPTKEMTLNLFKSKLNQAENEHLNLPTAKYSCDMKKPPVPQNKTLSIKKEPKKVSIGALK